MKTFEVGETIFCYHGPLIYEAKIIKLNEKLPMNEKRYYVHYNGWNKSWDEWVDSNRMLKHNAENINLQKELKYLINTKKERAETLNTKPISKFGSLTPIESDIKKNSKFHSKIKDNTLSKNDISIKSEIKNKKITTVHETSQILEDVKLVMDNLNQPSQTLNHTLYIPDIEYHNLSNQAREKFYLRLHLPKNLQAYLLNDWDFVTQQQKLIRLPARITVENILDTFIEYTNSENGNNILKQNSLDYTNRMKQYFNTLLGCQLLYSFERPQYADILDCMSDDQSNDHFKGKFEKNTISSPNKFTFIYGGAHLLRLIALLLERIESYAMDQKSAKQFVSTFDQFIRFLSVNECSLLNTPHEYECATSDYYRKII